MSAETLVGFVLASVLLALSPGPDNLFVLAQSALQGRLAGIVITLGLCTGLIVHTAAVALGVAALIQTSPTAFLALKIMGAGYLVYLAWGAFRAGKAADGNAGAVSLTYSRLYRRGIVMNVSNPKVTIFFLAFLPQFVDASLGNATAQIALLGALFMLSALLVFSVIAVAAGGLSDYLRRSPMALAWLNRLAGAVFVLLALRLLLAEAG
ncbi:MAG: LysE family translocator [Gammaproteobacteria bacterium]